MKRKLIACLVGVDVHYREQIALFKPLWSALFGYSLCSPELVPQMEGTLLPDALVTEKMSVRHCEATVDGFPAVLTAPFKVLVTVLVAVLGPVMTNVWKSRRS